MPELKEGLKIGAIGFHSPKEGCDRHAIVVFLCLDHPEMPPAFGTLRVHLNFCLKKEGRFMQFTGLIGLYTQSQSIFTPWSNS